MPKFHLIKGSKIFLRKTQKDIQALPYRQKKSKEGNHTESWTSRRSSPDSIKALEETPMIFMHY